MSRGLLISRFCISPEQERADGADDLPGNCRLDSGCDFPSSASPRPRAGIVDGRCAVQGRLGEYWKLLMVLVDEHLVRHAEDVAVSP